MPRSVAEGSTTLVIKVLKFHASEDSSRLLAVPFRVCWTV
jgi:hypothetical protein